MPEPTAGVNAHGDFVPIEVIDCGELMQVENRRHAPAYSLSSESPGTRMNDVVKASRVFARGIVTRSTLCLGGEATAEALLPGSTMSTLDT